MQTQEQGCFFERIGGVTKILVTEFLNIKLFLGRELPQKWNIDTFGKLFCLREQ